jgi:hypothetical protein
MVGWQRDELEMLVAHGAFNDEKDQERLNKIAFLAVEFSDAGASRSAFDTLGGVCRAWRRRQEDLAEASELSLRSDIWLSRRALAKQERHLVDEEAKIDRELDKLIRKHNLGEGWETFQAIDRA